MNQKGFANIILVVVIVILVGAVGYFAFVKKSEPVAQQPTPTPTQTKTFTPTPTPTPVDLTANWKTYSNTTLGYSVKYPSDWQFTEDNGSGCKYCLYPKGGTGSYEGRGTSFVFNEPTELSAYLKNVDVYNKSVTSLQSYLDTYSKQSVCAPGGVAAGDAYCVSYKKIIFQSIPAYLVAVGGMGSGYNITFEYRGKVYNISLPSTSKGSLDFKDLTTTEQSILLSYKLLK